jgi:predicted Fe-Mo cluster-binding NifX family protein
MFTARFLLLGEGQGASPMKVALTVWDGRMAPVFDVSREALVLTIEDGGITSRSLEKIETPMGWLKLERLTQLGIQTLVCGAITEPLQHELSVRGVKVIAFVAGEIDEVVKSFLDNTLPTRALSMPGCCGKQNRFRGGRGCTGWRGGTGGRKGRP